MHRTLFLHMIFLLMCNRGKSEGNFTKSKVSEMEIDDISNCDNNTKLLPVLPGLGWDGLLGRTLSRVLRLSYSQCKTTSDGLFLIPDEVFAIPLKEYTISTQYIEDWRDFKSVTAKSFVTAIAHPLLHVVNTDLFSLVKDRQVRLNESAMFVEVRYTMYRVGIERNAEVVPLLQMLLLRAATFIEEDDESSAEYLLQHIVHDYGTHFVTSVDVGGIILQEDFLSKEKTEAKQLKKSDLSVLATAAFKKNFEGFPTGLDQISTLELHPSDLQIYYYMKKDSIIQVIGGAPLDKNKNIYLWASTVQNHMERIDHTADPLHQLISSTYLPIPTNVSEVLRAKLIKIIDKYYSLNTHKGCMEKDDPNFDVSANIDDGSCKKPFYQTLFGGLYQTCRPSTGSKITGKLNLCQTKYLNHVNPITNNYNCPPSYYEWMLLNQTVSLNMTSQDCWDSCDGWWVFQKCHKECKAVYNYNEARYYTFWCVPRNKISTSNGFLFGGAYSSSSNNDITHRKFCPPTFTAFSVGEDIKICASLDHKEGYKHSVPFGGFYSCSKPNPLSAKDSHNAKMHCSSGYVAHSVHSLQNCNLYYCSKAKKRPKSSIPVKNVIPFVSANASLYLSIVNESLDLLSKMKEININHTDDVMATSNNFCLFPETVGTDITKICQNTTTEFNTTIGNDTMRIIIKCENETERKMIDYKNWTDEIQKDSKNNADVNQTNLICTANENGTNNKCIMSKNATDQKQISSDSVACWDSGNGSVCVDKKNDTLNTIKGINKTCADNDTETFTICDEKASSEINEDKRLKLDAQNKTQASQSTENMTAAVNWNITNISAEGNIEVPTTEGQLTTHTIVTNMSWPGAKDETTNIENSNTLTTAILITICVVTCLTVTSVIGYCLWRRKRTSMKIDNNQITLGPV